MLVFPELVLDGQVPNRDFLHLYGPGGLWVLAAAFTVFGTTLARRAGRRVPPAARRRLRRVRRCRGRGGVGRRRRRRVAAAIVVIPPIGLTALAWVGARGPRAVVGASPSPRRAGADAGDRAPGRLVVGAGLLGGAALLYRLDLVARGRPVAVSSWCSASTAGAAASLLLVAAAAGVSPYLVHLVMAGPGQRGRGLVLEPVVRPPRRADACRSRRRRDRFDGFLQRAGLLDEPPWPFPSPPSPAQLRLWLAAARSRADAVLVRRRRRLLRRARRPRACSPSRAFASGCSPRPCSGPTPPTWPG